MRKVNYVKIKTFFPKLYKWDQEQRVALRQGKITKEEYIRKREENFADAMESEEEERIEQEKDRKARIAKSKA